MPTTIIGNTPATMPEVFAAPIIEMSNLPTTGWVVQPDLTMVSVGGRVGAQASTAEIERRYGTVKFPHETAFSTKTPRSLFKQWIRISSLNPQGATVMFVGQVENESRALAGSPTIPAGHQRWVVNGGLKILQRIMVNQSIWQRGDNSTFATDWIPAMNARDKRGLLVGNRSTTSETDPAFYGGNQVWTHLQYVKYLLANFVQVGGGPVWTVTGDVTTLGNLKTTVKFPENASVADQLKHLIPVKYGLDFVVWPNANGFEIYVFAGSGNSFSIGGITMPANPNTVKVMKTTDKDLIEVNWVESSERKVDRIEVLGKRIVVCGTLTAAGNSLIPKWPTGLESEYSAAGGSTDPAERDKVRRRDRYKEVYQHYGAPATWNMQGGIWSVACNDDGSLTTGPYQVVHRETLSYIPLKEGFDYSTTPPTDNTLGNTTQQQDVKHPLAWVYDSAPIDGSPARQVQCDLVGIHVDHPYQDWGIVLNGNPNHALSLNSGFDQTTTNYNGVLYDKATISATIAIESDHRLMLAYNVPAAIAAGDDSVMSIIVDEAELWVMLPNTALDVATNGLTLVTSGSTIQKLRDDTQRLALVMAGAVVRYSTDRYRVHLVFKGFQPFLNLLGQILTVIQQGDNLQQIGAPITSVEWILHPTPITIVKTGYA